MTRDFVFTLTVVGQNFNLWDMINATIVDKTLSNSGFVPKMVKELEVQNLTAGSTIRRSSSPIATTGFEITSGSWDINRSSTHDIDLTSKNFKTDVAGAQIYVQIIF